MLNTRHKATGEVFPQAIEVMTTLNRDASRAALAAGAVCATDVTGFGLLGHLYKLARASGVTAVVDVASVPYVEGARQAVRDGYVSGGTRRNLDWVRPHLDPGRYAEEDLLLLADAQTSAACWSPVRSPARRSSANSSRPRPPRSGSPETSISAAIATRW